MKLVIGNKNYSSWSLRSWWLLKYLDVPFNEVLVPLGQPETRTTLLQYSPSGKVPVLIDGEEKSWDSLAITEYCYENHRGVWPENRAMRTHARAVCAEMHAGFSALRSEMPMNCKAQVGLAPSAACASDIERILAIWRDCRVRYGHLGPWLFGAWSAADAFFAPVVMRFRSYGVVLDEVSSSYVQTILIDSHIHEWLADASQETWTYPATDAIADAAGLGK